MNEELVKEEETNDIRSYNFNVYYIKMLIKLSKYTDKRTIADKLGLTENALYLKLTERSLLYINEGILIADELHMNILDVFCPTEQNMYDVLYDANSNFKETTYNEFNFNQKFIKKLMLNKEVTVKDICKLWNFKQGNVYDKIRGETKITVKEGVLLSNLLDVDIGYLFCSTDEEILKVLSKDFKHKYAEKKDTTLIIKDFKGISEGFNMNNLTFNRIYIKYLLKQQHKKMDDLRRLWNLSMTHMYNKLSKKNIDVEEAIKLSQYLDLPLKKIFNPNKTQLKKAQDYFDEISRLSNERLKKYQK